MGHSLGHLLGAIGALFGALFGALIAILIRIIIRSVWSAYLMEMATFQVSGEKTSHEVYFGSRTTVVVRVDAFTS